MRVMKCPRCEINFIKEDEKVCSICRREIKGEAAPEVNIDMCIECGENPAAPGEDLCIFCLNERKLPEEDAVADEIDGDVAIPDEDLSMMDEIDVTMQTEDIPETELEVIHKEFGIDDTEADFADLEDEEDDEFSERP